MADDGAGDLVVEARPATVAVELVLSGVQRRIAAGAKRSPRNLQRPVFTGKGPLGSLVHEDPRFFGCQLVVRACRVLAIHTRPTPREKFKSGGDGGGDDIAAGGGGLCHRRSQTARLRQRE